MISDGVAEDSSSILPPPSIAIIIAIYNGAETLAACLESLVEQHVLPDQIIIQDGGSIDDTLKIVEAFRPHLSHVTSVRDAGIYDAWNKALQHVQSDWVWFLGCDDCLADKNVIARLKEDLSSAPADVGLVYGIAHNVSPNGLVSERVGKPWGRAKEAIAYRMSVPHTALLSRSSLFSSVGKFDIRYRIAGDFEWFSRAIRVANVAFLERVLVLAGDGGVSQHIGTQLKTVTEYGEIIRSRGNQRPLAWFWLYATAAVKAAIHERLGHRARLVLVNVYRLMTFRSLRASRT